MAMEPNDADVDDADVDDAVGGVDIVVDDVVGVDDVE